MRTDMPPPSVRLIRGAAAAMRRQPWLAALAAAAMIALLTLGNALYVVGNGETAARRRFGRVVEQAMPPGLGLAAPWGIDRVSVVRSGEVRREEVTGDDGGPLALLTGDENIIEMAVVVQYTVGNAGAFLFAVDDPRVLLIQALRAALVETAAAMTVDDVLTAGKAAIQQEVRRRAQVSLDRAGAGLTLTGVNLQWAQPPPEAAQAFRAVNDAKADSSRAVSDAQSQRERALSLARGEASTIANAGRAEAAERLQSAHGATARFASLLAQRRQARDATDLHLALDAARRVLPRAHLVVLAPGEAPHIDLNLLGHSAPPAPAPPQP